MSARRLLLLVTSSLAVPVVLALALAGPAGAEPAGARPTFGSHVSTCAQHATGFTGEHNPSHHRGPAGWDGEHCLTPGT